MSAAVKRLTDDERQQAQAAGEWCVVCHKRYGDDEHRADLHVYPDGCTAHDACYMSEEGSGTAHWHAKTEVCERCGEREPTTDVGGWLCDPCAEAYRTPAARDTNGSAA